MNEYFVSNRNESVRMFRPDWMEKTTYVHPLVPHVIYVPLIIFLLWTSPLSIGASVMWFLIGLLVWTLIEYLLHRFAFHAPDEVMDKVHEIVAGLPVDEAVVPNMPSLRHTIYFLFHGVHHEYPSDARRLVMPPVASIPMAFVVWLVFLLVFGTAARPAFAGMMIGYLIYDSTHFLVHHYSMPTKFGKFIKRQHMRHHFKDPDKDYGVSSPLWDVIFRTFSGDRNRTTPKTEVGTGA
ncbi:MAG: sterol desaturase family protein [Gemmatimonadetes bacterium]|nr:sterol desaturase family protein [Gemmatimonadota bacterium]